MRINKTAALAVFLFLLPAAGMAGPKIKILVEAEKDTQYDYSIPGEEISKEFFFGDNFSPIPGLDIISKGIPGVQEHFIFNGATFEQAAILIDGIKVNDPQTGHFHFDLPFTVLDYGSVKVINNAGMAEGEAGFSGIINLETAGYKGDEKKAAGGYAGYNTYFTAGRVAKDMGNYHMTVSGEKRGSAGYHKATDYDENRGMVKIGSGGYSITTALSAKNFGAYDFYTPGMGRPSRQEISTFFSNARGEISENFVINAYTRVHNDYFILDEDNPNYYSNRHKTEIIGGKAAYGIIGGKKGRVNINYGYNTERIESGSLGNHTRHRNSGGISGFYKLKGAGLAGAGVAVEKYAEEADVFFMPSAYLKFDFGGNFGAGAGYAYSARQPNFTELYYSGPYNKGNENLDAERVHDIKGSLSVKSDSTVTVFSGFYRYGYDLIDWGKQEEGDSIWRVQNTGEISTLGLSAETEFEIEPVKFRAVYTYLDSQRSKDYISKYGLAYLRNDFYIKGTYPAEGVTLAVKYEYKKYINREEAYHGFSCSIESRINKNSAVILKADNIFNIYYEQIPGIPAPGRMLSISAVSSY